ncbi:hypothetical protein [Corynebacterium pseudotuberculosis]|uniref:hypothetical protein n=1 Tax=Corynebacterium pseudotuberculosis TaxID=1719 RepID=UPI00090B4DBB|nr:hypothetical protein [Corynebacterium pseudotuberculosis]APG82577.1 Hypothetical protein CPI37_1959 [Corynebacterium pseudotuberculosis]
MKKLLSSVLTCAIAGSLLVASAANATEHGPDRTSASVRGIYDPKTNRWICASSASITYPDSHASLLSIGSCTHPEYTVLLNTVFEHLEETIDQVDHLTDDVKNLEKKVEASEYEIDHLHKNLKNSRNELDATKHKNRELTAKIVQAKKNIEELKEKKLLTEEELSTAKAKIKELTNKVQKLEKEVKELKERNAELQRENHDLLSKIDSLNTKNASLHKDLNASFGLNVFFGVISAIAAIIGIGHFLKPVFEKFFHRR